MKNNTSTTAQQMIQSMKSMTVDERMSYLKSHRSDIFEATPRVMSFGKAPKGGWTDADRVK